MSGLAPAHFPRDAGARTVLTDSLLLTKHSLEQLVEYRAMGAFVGPAGTGKTYALGALSGRLTDVRVVWLEFEADPTLLHIAQLLHAALTGESGEGLRRKHLSSLILDRLAGSRRPILLVVDEAQRLNSKCIEYLRYLHDHVSTGFAMALAGGNGCWEVISGEPMLLSRIFRKVSFQPMSPAQVVTTIPDYHDIYRKADPDLIEEVDSRCCQGIFRNWASFTATAVDLGCTDTLNRSIAETAIQLLPGNRSG